MLRPVCCMALILTLLVSTGFASELTDSLKTGPVDLQSASQLAFGPEGILFIGDSLRGAVIAVATEDTKPARPIL